MFESYCWLETDRHGALFWDLWSWGQGSGVVDLNLAAEGPARVGNMRPILLWCDRRNLNKPKGRGATKCCFRNKPPLKCNTKDQHSSLWGKVSSPDYYSQLKMWHFSSFFLASSIRCMSTSDIKYTDVTQHEEPLPCILRSSFWSPGE